MNQKLSLCIPTYNRAKYLDKCLSALLPQLQRFENLIDLYISSNGSTDNTNEIVSRYINLGHKITYFIQPTNLGMDGNFGFLYENVQSDYIWMLSDDEVLLPNALEKVFEIVFKQDFGVIFLNNYWYDDELDIEKINYSEAAKITKYTNPIEFCDRVNYWFTFISGNIINRSAIKNKVNIYDFDKTYLILLAWIIPSVFSNKPNFFIENQIMACKGNNTGGYKLFKVFGENFNNVLKIMESQNLIDKRVRPLINDHLLKSFFPAFLNATNDKFEKENPIGMMIKTFWKHPRFWRSTLPKLIKLSR